MIAVGDTHFTNLLFAGARLFGGGVPRRADARLVDDAATRAEVAGTLFLGR
jgi:hypothetical protein